MSAVEPSEGDRWLRFAAEDLATAERLLEVDWAPPRHVCFFAQQAAEKALKAALMHQRQDFPFTHDLDVLRNRLPPGWPAVHALPPLGRLTRWAVGARYVGDWPEPRHADARDAAAFARQVLDAVRKDLAGGSR